MTLAIALQQPTAYDRAVNFMLTRPSITARDIAGQIGVPPSVAKTYLDKMVNAGMITPPNDIGRSLVKANMRSGPEPAVDGDIAVMISAPGIEPVHTTLGAMTAATERLKDDAPRSFSADDVMSGAAQTRLRTIIERVERLEDDKAGITDDIKEVYDEAKGEGFDVKILRKVVSLRKKDKVKRDEEEALLDMYLNAIGDR